MELSIKQATPADIDALQTISRETFFAAFADQNSEEDMQAYLENNLGKEKLLAEISTSGSLFYLAFDDNQLIGYLKLNSGAAQTDLQDPKSMEVERIYVLPGYFGKQAGKQLLNFALEKAHAQQAAFIWLGVWEQNYRAIRFYQKHGFQEFGRHNFMLGADLQTDLLLRKALH